MKRLLVKVSFPLFIVSLLVAACVVQESAITGDRRAYGYSWEQEIQLGKEADQQIQQQYGIYDNEELQKYVDQIGQEMLEVSHMRRENTPEQYKNTEFYFRVLDSPVINAFALPGGYVYVTRGLLSHLDNEAQLAVVLGHEIGHVAARHASQRAFEQQLGQVALLGGAVAGEQFLGIPGRSVLNLGSQAAQLLFLSYSRDDERESDRLGVEYSAMKNYQAAEGAKFFVTLRRMAKQTGQSIPDWQSTHPDPSERANTIPDLTQQWREKGYEMTIEDTDEYMNHIDDIVYGDNPRNGFTRDGFFYHPDLKFQFPYPTDWQVINQRSLVAIVNKEQDAVSVMKLDSESANAQVSVNEFLNQEGITTVESSSISGGGGLPAYNAIATGQTDNGDQLKFYVYAVEYGERIYRFLNYTSLNQYATYEPRFKEITDGFKQLTKEEILNIQPVRLQVFKADKSDTFESFLPADFEGMPVKITPKELAILNQVELEEQIDAGTWIKIPRQ